MKVRIALVTLAALLIAACAMAQGNAYSIPKGSKLAIVVYEDLECPACAADDPTLVNASHVYKIPLVRHDYPLRMHTWALQGAIYAVYFDSKSAVLGDEFRRWVFAHQREIYIGNLRQKVELFAKGKGQTVPANVDPNGAFAAKISKDRALGDTTGLTHTPTIFIVGITRNGPTHVEVQDINQLFATIDGVKKSVESGGTTGKKAHR